MSVKKPGIQKWDVEKKICSWPQAKLCYKNPQKTGKNGQKYLENALFCQLHNNYSKGDHKTYVFAFCFSISISG